MTAAFVYLTACSIRNGSLVKLRRLRQPRYLIGTIVGLLYFYFYVFGGLHRATGEGPRTPWDVVTGTGISFELIGLVALLAIVSLAWLWPRTGPALAFTPPEVQFLFSAPVTRRQLLHYKLLRTQVGGLAGAAFITLLAQPDSIAVALKIWLGLWLVFATVDLHLVGVAFRRQSLAAHGGGAWRRQRIALLIVAAIIIVVTVAIIRTWPALAAARSVAEVFATLQLAMSTGLAGVALWPIHVVAHLPFADPGADFARAVPAVLALLALNYVWVLRSDAAFEEASAEQAERWATRRGGPPPRIVRRSRATPFRLAPTGRPELAIVWKNLTLFSRPMSLLLLLTLLPIVVSMAVIAVVLADDMPVVQIIGVLSAIFAVLTLLFGPQVVRNDLRHDLGRLAIVKTWPIRGATIIRAEILAPTLILSMLAAVAVPIAAIGLSGATTTSGEPVIADPLSYTAVALIISPTLILVQVLIQNAIALMFPAWVTLGPAPGRGSLDATGQHMVLTLAGMLAFTIALVPGAIAAGAVGAVSHWLSGRVWMVPSAMAAAAVLLVECWITTELLGLVFDRTDVTAVDAPG
jgi:hypothetical protein